LTFIYYLLINNYESGGGYISILLNLIYLEGYSSRILCPVTFYLSFLAITTSLSLKLTHPMIITVFYYKSKQQILFQVNIAKLLPH